MRKIRKFTAVDLFCGAGGLSLAARNIGIHVLAAMDNEKYACRTYRRNFVKGWRNPPILIERDVLGVHGLEILKMINLRPEDLDILMGGPPCQGYSIHRLRDSGVKDPRNALLVRYMELVRDIRPRVFIVENVPGMLWPRHADYVRKFYQMARKAGYTVLPPVILNARDYGVPQNRERVFILGSKPSDSSPVIWPPPQTHFNPHSVEVLEQRRQAWRTASDVFNRQINREDPNDLRMNHSRELISVFESTPRNGGSRMQSNRQLRCHRNHDGHRDVYGRIDLSKPGPTMTTACINPSKGRFLHPIENRGISVREAARFQTFSDSFIFEGGLITCGLQVGNAVPVLLGEAVLGAIMDALKFKDY